MEISVLLMEEPGVFRSLLRCLDLGGGLADKPGPPPCCSCCCALPWPGFGRNTPSYDAQRPFREERQNLLDLVNTMEIAFPAIIEAAAHRQR